MAPQAGATVVGPYRYDGKLWEADPLPAVPEVTGRDASAAAAATPAPEPKGSRAVEQHQPATPNWPAAASATVHLDNGNGGGNGARSAVGLPVKLAPAEGKTPGAVRVETTDRAKARAANVDGLLVGLTRADGDPAEGKVAVSVDYGAIAQAYGGGWASRLHLVQLPACALTTPELARCRTQTPLPTTNDPVTRQLTATVAVAGDAPSDGAAVKAADTASDGTAVQALSTRTGGTAVQALSTQLTAVSGGAATTAVAAVAGASGSQGDYGATPLSASGAWSSSASGSFTYNYPIQAPASLGGSAPSVALSYDSQSVDGETSARNSQASWIGDGWSYSPGYIERSYKSCANAGIEGSGDMCWSGWNATLALGSHNGQLIRDSSGAYHLQSDDGTRIERLTGASNGLWDGEYFKVTTTDGTQYYLGLNHAPGTTSDAATNSAWGEPVYMPKAGDPCYSASAGKASQCAAQPGWRFNLDFVVDPHGNLQRYDWANEANWYNAGNGQSNGAGGKMTAYTRGGYLTRISYGYQLADAKAGREPAAEVVFDTAQRCTVSDTTCQYANLNATTAPNWPDTPYDLNCTSTMATTGSGSNVCRASSPSFWSTYRLKSVTTKVRAAGGWQDVDSWALTQLFSDAGGTVDPVTGKTEDPQQAGALQSVMWLSQIQHTGLDTSAGGSGAVTLDPTTFTGIEMDNRVDGLTPAAPPLYHPRISGVRTESGESIAVTYREPECSRVNNHMPASPDSDTMACYNVSWSIPGAVEPISDWFHKALVAQISDSDATKANSPARITTYTYSGGAAWHRNDSEAVNDQYRTWDQYRGYRTITTTTGSAPDPVTQTVTHYLQGMDGDYKADGTKRSVSLTNSLGEATTDSNWLAGTAQETDTYDRAGGTVIAKKLTAAPTYTTVASSPQTAWTSKTPAPAKLSTLPDLTARRIQNASERKQELLADGTTWRTTRIDARYDSLGRLVESDNKGDLSVPSQEVCTTSSYATPPASNPMMLAYQSEAISIAGPCGTPASASTTVSDDRTYYDGDGTLTGLPALGQLGSTGNITAKQSVTSYDAAGAAVFQTDSATSYDQYGRVTKVLDAAGAATSTGYSPSTGTQPTTVTNTNPLGWATTSTLAPGRSLPTGVADQNGRSTALTYDALGRRTAVWFPGRSKATQSADRLFSYSVKGADTPNPPSVTTQTLREDGSYGVEVAIYDGFLNQRQAQTTTADNSAGRLVTSTRYDSHGWASITVPTYADPTTAPGSTLFVETENTLPAETVTAYDGTGRPVSSTSYSKAHQLWRTTTAYPGADRTDTTPPAGAAPTSTRTDASGRTTAKVTHGGDGIGDVTTSYGYDPAGRLTSVKDTQGNTWSYTYDLRGRKTSQTDPDSGTSTTGYDLLGRTATSTDGRGQVLSYSYDQLGRKTGEYDGGSTTDSSKLLASWSYDTLVKGYLTSATRYDGGNAYTTAITGYTTSYQPTGTTVTIPTAEGKLAGSYTLGADYTAVTGLLAHSNFGADGGLAAESVGYGYNLQGGLVSSGSGRFTHYLDIANYSPLGQVVQSTYGDAGKQFRTAQTYDEATGRLATNRVSLETAPDSPASDTTYGYDQAGNITTVSERQSVFGTSQVTDTQCFRYDGMDRLTTAWTDTAGITTPTAGQLAGCTSTAPGTGTVGGPNPYWQDYGYNLLGDRTQQVQHDLTGNTANDTTQTLAYPTDGKQPNAVSTVTTGKSGATSTLSAQYDPAGHTTKRTVTGASPSTQTYGYDAEGRVRSVEVKQGSSNAQTSTYLYDANGDLLLQRNPGTVTLYLFGGAEQLTLTGGNVTALRSYSNPDGTRIVRSSTGAVTYLPTNPQHTAQLQVDSATLSTTRRAYDPYGNLRGAQPGSWADNRGYLGQPADPTTGLDLLGARQYDPTIGRFISVDPLFEADDPNQMGGYGYASSNPTTKSDPDGLASICGQYGSAPCSTGRGDTYQYDNPMACATYNCYQQLSQQVKDLQSKQANLNSEAAHCVNSSCYQQTMAQMGPVTTDGHSVITNMTRVREEAMAAQAAKDAEAKKKHGCGWDLWCQAGKGLSAVGDGLGKGLSAVGDFIDEHSTAIGLISLGLALTATVLTFGAASPLLVVATAGTLNEVVLGLGIAVTAIDAASAANACFGKQRSTAGCTAGVAGVVIDVAGLGAGKLLAKPLQAGIKSVMRVDSYGVRYWTNAEKAVERTANKMMGGALFGGTLGVYCGTASWCNS
ncbi:RHS repeat-associated core domain-containing protein [Kitasatospora saccharophila]